MKKCSVCGTLSDSKFCPECGASLEGLPEVDSTKNDSAEPINNDNTVSEDSVESDVDNSRVDEGLAKPDTSKRTVVEESVVTQVNGEAIPQNYDNSQLESKKKSKKKIIIIAAIVLAVIIVGVFLSNAAKQRAAEEAAVEEYYSAIASMRGNAAMMQLTVNDTMGDLVEKKIDTCEELVNLTNAVWHDSIFNESSEETSKYIKGTSDFNDALNNLYTDTEVIELNNTLYDYQKMASEVEIPESLSDVKSSYVTLVTAYKAIADWCDWPNGSYSTYMSSSQEKFDAFNNAYNEFDIVCPQNPETENDSEEDGSSGTEQ